MDGEPALAIDDHLPFLARALEEDHAANDVTARAVVPADRAAVADVFARETLVVAGLPLAAAVFRILDDDAVVDLAVEDGEQVSAGTRVLTVSGRARAILAAERTALNLLGRLCGVATLTHDFVEAGLGTGARIYDTRKTTPGWRALEKYAVRCGGGENHRSDLADAAMIKENHLYAAFGRTGPESIREAIRRCRASLPAGTVVYCEVETLEELDAAAAEKADVILLDGFELGDVRRAVQRVRALPPPRPQLEATGGVRLDTVEALASAGVTRLSAGALTRSATIRDLSLRVRRQEPLPPRSG
jgi:nicotinate-nucleotide pyrophosphorylase (carboxylating)